MAAQKKVLIAYASAGHGHEKAAMAVLEAFKTACPQCAVSVVDTAKLSGPFFGAIYKESYLFQIRSMPWLWGAFYYTFDNPLVYFFARYARRALNAVTVKPLADLLVGEQPDLVIATHFQSIEITSYLKQKKLITSKLVAVVTDYLPHFVWTADLVDRHMVALEETKQELVKRGVGADTVDVTGIPVSAKFTAHLDKAQVRGKLGLSDRFTALLTSGGAGMGDIELIAKGVFARNFDAQLLVVCGTNRELFKRLEPLTAVHPGLKIYPFVNYMDELMSASDVVIGKGGGITLTEAFVKSKPFILFRSVPGQEGRNGLIVKKYDAGVVTNSPETVLDTLERWARDPKERARAEAGAKELARPDAARRIAEISASLI